MSKMDGTKSLGEFRFLGVDGSLGYKTGRVYDLEVFMSFVGEKQEVMIERKNLGAPNDGRCIYTTTKAFQRNWSCQKLISGPDLITDYNERSKGIPIQLNQILENLEEEVNGKN